VESLTVPEILPPQPLGLMSEAQAAGSKAEKIRLILRSVVSILVLSYPEAAFPFLPLKSPRRANPPEFCPGRELRHSPSFVFAQEAQKSQQKNQETRLNWRNTCVYRSQLAAICKPVAGSRINAAVVSPLGCRLPILAVSLAKGSPVGDRTSLFSYPAAHSQES